MKLVVYKGLCKTVTEKGKKFTEKLRSYVVSDEDGKYFKSLQDFDVFDIPETKEVKTEQSEVKTSVEIDEKLRLKLQKMGTEALREMCKSKGLAIDGKKEELISRLIESAGE